MRRRNRLVSLLGVCLLLANALACSAPRPAPTVDVELATGVAATLTALASPASGEPSITQPAGFSSRTPQPPEVTPSAPAEETIPGTGATLPPSGGGIAVAYAKENSLRLWSEGAGSQLLARPGQVSSLKISPDGQFIAYLRQVDDFHTELWAVNRFGTDDHSLVGVADLDAMDPAGRDPGSKALAPYQFAWVPNSHVIAFNTRQIFEGPGVAPFEDLRLVNADSDQIATLLPAGQGGEFVFSPDSTQVAVITPNKISLINADGSNRRDGVLNYATIVTYSEYRYYVRPVWATDSSSLRVAIPPADPLSNPRQPTSLWTIPLDGSPAEKIGQVIAAPFFGSEVMISPDLAHILYLRESGSPEQNTSEIHIARLDGSQDMLYLTATLVQLMGWSPDSSHFVFRQGEGQEVKLGQILAKLASLPGGLTGVTAVTWVDAGQFLCLQKNGLAYSLKLVTLKGQAAEVDTAGDLPLVFDFAR